MPNEIREYLANAIHDFNLDVDSIRDEFKSICKKSNGGEEYWEAIVESGNTDIQLWAILSDFSYYQGYSVYGGDYIEPKDYGSPSNDKANLSGKIKIKYWPNEGVSSLPYTSMGPIPIDTGEEQFIAYVFYNQGFDEEFGLQGNFMSVPVLNKARLYKELAFFFEPYPSYVNSCENFVGLGAALLPCVKDAIQSGDWMLVLAAMKTALNNGYLDCPEVLDLLSDYEKIPQVKDFLLKHCGYNILSAFHPSEVINLSEKELASILPTILSYVPYAPFRCDSKFTKMVKNKRGGIIVPRLTVSKYFTNEVEKKVLDYGLHGVPEELGITSIKTIPANKLAAVNKALAGVKKVLLTDNEFANEAGDGASCNDWTYAELHNVKVCDDSYDVLDVTYLYLYKKDGTYSTISMVDMGTDCPKYDEILWGPIENQVAELIRSVSSLFGRVQSIIFPVNGNITCGTITKSVQEKGTVHILLGN